MIRAQDAAGQDDPMLATQEGNHKKAAHRIVFEEISQKRKLKTYLSFSTVAPEGFTFIPAGDPQLTRRCKQISQRDGHAVFIVSAGARLKFQLSREIHRVGHHFSNFVLDKASQSLGVSINASGRVTASHLAQIPDERDDRSRLYRFLQQKKPRPKLQRGSPKIDLSLDQAIIDTRAREAIQDLFPNIPSLDLHEIVSRAFDKTRELVGTASGTSLVRRANLAVVAHIRHMYTNYDELLRSNIDRTEARKGVEQFILDKLAHWRSDEEDNNLLMEDVLREVIVISDDEQEDQGEKDKSERTFSTRDDTLPVASEQDRQLAQRLVEDGHDFTELEDGEISDSDDEAPPPSELPPRRQSEVILKNARIQKGQNHRRAKWKDALQRRRLQQRISREIQGCNPQKSTVIPMSDSNGLASLTKDLGSLTAQALDGKPAQEAGDTDPHIRHIQRVVRLDDCGQASDAASTIPRSIKGGSNSSSSFQRSGSEKRPQPRVVRLHDASNTQPAQDSNSKATAMDSHKRAPNHGLSAGPSSVGADLQAALLPPTHPNPLPKNPLLSRRSSLGFTSTKLLPQTFPTSTSATVQPQARLPQRPPLTVPIFPHPVNFHHPLPNPPPTISSNGLIHQTSFQHQQSSHQQPILPPIPPKQYGPNAWPQPPAAWPTPFHPAW